MATNQSIKLGKLLRKGRNDAGYSQRDVEEEKGVSNAYLSQIESGKIREPSPTILHKLAELYGIDYGELLEMAGYPVPQFGKKKKSLFRASNRLGPLSGEEEEALEDYLSFLRSKERKK